MCLSESRMRGRHIIYAITGNLKCFECGDVGHKRSIRPHKSGSSGVNSTQNSTVDSMASESNGGQTTPNVNIIADSETRSEFNGGQTTPDVNIIADSEATIESYEGQFLM